MSDTPVFEVTEDLKEASKQAAKRLRQDSDESLEGAIDFVMGPEGPETRDRGSCGCDSLFADQCQLGGTVPCNCGCHTVSLTPDETTTTGDKPL